MNYHHKKERLFSPDSIPETGAPLPRVLDGILADANVRLENYSAGRSLVKDGRWNIPIEQRPKDWEKMGIPE